MKISVIVLIFVLGAIGFSCNEAKPTKNSSSTSGIKKGVAPVADNEVAVIEMENSSAYGTITIELYSNIAPKMVARFKELAKEGVYAGTSFHRVNQSVVQGGDPNSKDDDPLNDGTGNSDKPNVQAEFSDIPYDTAIVGAARQGGDVNSQNSQFFIMLKREPGFDKNYTVFGKVIDGMNNVRTISGVSPKEGERPVEAIKIKSITFKPKG
jgi:peptidylprolyl isomerase